MVTQMCIRDSGEAGGVQTLGSQLLHGAVLRLADDVGHLYHLGAPADHEADGVPW